MVASDSPTRVRKRVAIWLRVLSTSSFRAACACSSARMSPVVQCLARRPRTYWLPSVAIDPSRTGGAAGPDAHALRNVGSQSRIRRLVHQRQRAADAFVGDEAEERRLLKLHRQSLSQRIVEHWVAGRVGELGEDDRVLVGQRRRLSRIEEVARSGHGDAAAAAATTVQRARAYRGRLFAAVSAESDPRVRRSRSVRRSAAC